MRSYKIALLTKYYQNIWKKRINSPLGGREGVPGIRAGSRRMRGRWQGGEGILDRNWLKSLFIHRSIKVQRCHEFIFILHN